ncbi:MAG: glycosyltransferase family 4 protein [Victivallaceae bacterium]|nr:glycosyltransferase family 4 protein [Victivallaceae bacterium]
MKICHIITRMIVGGAQENTLLTIADHVRKGHQVTLVTGFSPGREGKLLENVDFPEFEIVTIPSLIRELSPMQDLKAYRELVRFFRERQFDVVHTHSSKAGILGRIAARRAGVPVVVHTVHGQAFHPYEKFYRNAIYIASEWLAAKFCDRIYAVAQAMIDSSVAAHVAPREKYRVVYSGMDTRRFAAAQPSEELRASLGIPPDVPVVAALARLFPLKGYEFLIPAAADICKRFPKTRFLVIGDGPMRAELDEKIAQYGLTDHFVFAGLVPPEKVADYLALSDLLCHLSLREGLPRSAVQSLASGRPVVAFRLDGTPEVVRNDQTGFCVTPESVPEVVAAVCTLLEDEELRRRLGENGRKLVLEQFDWHKMGDILEQEYAGLLQSKRGKATPGN